MKYSEAIKLLRLKMCLTKTEFGLAFAHYQMKKLFKVKTVIPKMIYQEVKNRIDILIDRDLTTLGGLK